MRALCLGLVCQNLDEGADPVRSEEEKRALDEDEIRRSMDAECIICSEVGGGRGGREGGVKRRGWRVVCGWLRCPHVRALAVLCLAPLLLLAAVVG